MVISCLIFRFEMLDLSVVMWFEILCFKIMGFFSWIGLKLL